MSWHTNLGLLGALFIICSIVYYLHGTRAAIATMTFLPPIVVMVFIASVYYFATLFSKR